MEKPTDIEVSMKFGPCVAPNTGVTSGGTTQSITGVQYSCANLLGSSQLTFVITWNTGQTSTLVGSFAGSVAGALIVNTGNGIVTQGLFQGASFLYTRTAPAADVLLCLIGMGTVSSSDGPVTLSIYSL